jgi:uncharacterized protein
MTAITHGGVQLAHQTALAAGQFLIQYCTACTKHIYPPCEVCLHCGSEQISLIVPKGLGTVYAVTTVRRKDVDGGDYNVVMVDLDEGVRLMSVVANVTPSHVHIGQRVVARVENTDRVNKVVFDLAGEAP